MDLWTAIVDVLILLLTALALGTLCERLKQSAILGYLLAGMLVGPNALDWMPNHRAIASIAELGVALLLFTIGLEFSWRRLLTIGPIAFLGGSLQVVITTILTALVCRACGLPIRPAIAVGAIVALSSTAFVLRLLITRAEIDSVHGRNALGILLLQDMAVVPLVLIVTVLGREGAPAEIFWELGRALLAATLVATALFVLLTYVVPHVLRSDEAARNRELPILLAITTAVGAAFAAHWFHLSPALGAFVAGMLLAESPYANQVRGDVTSLRTLFVTLFFSSIGMLADLAWTLEHALLVLAVVAAIILGKTLIIWIIATLLRYTVGHALATAICLAQVGEFSFVLAEVASKNNVIDDHIFKLMISATIVTLFLTPYLINAIPKLTNLTNRLCNHRPTTPPDPQQPHPDQHHNQPNRIVIIGFGPAGRRIAEALINKHKQQLLVIELNRKSADVARAYGVETHIADATRQDVLEHLHIQQARIVVVTVPDPAAARLVIEAARAINPRIPVIARARYHVYRWELMIAGAKTVIDEEEEVGLRIASAVRRELRST